MWKRRERKQLIKSGFVTRHFGLLGLLINLVVIGAVTLAKTGNQSPLEKAGILPEVVGSEQLQIKLNEFVEQKRRESIDIDKLGLIKPLRFSTADVKNVKLGFTFLRFDSAYDSHDFKVGLGKKKPLQDALRINGFLSK